MGENPDAHHPGDSFLEQLQAFLHQLRSHECQSRDVATGSGESGHEPAINRISNRAKDDGKRPGPLLRRKSRRCSLPEEKVNPQVN